MSRRADPRRLRAPAKGKHPPTSQVGALCWRRSRKGLRILLVTSRDSGRWVIPKGWPMRRRSGSEAAAREAWEEAGVRGEIGPITIGIYSYRKGLDNGDTIPCVVLVYPLEVHTMLRNYPETGQRRSRWFSSKKAAKRVREAQLARIIREFDPDELVLREPSEMASEALPESGASSHSDDAADDPQATPDAPAVGSP